MFLAIAALYALASLGTLTVRYESARPAAPPRAVLEEIVQGLSYVRGVPELWALMLTSLWVLLLGMPMQFLMPAFNSDVLAAGPEGLGFLTSAMGGGAVLGSLWVARLPTGQRTGTAMLASALLWALALMIFSLTTSLLGAATAAALVGLGSALFMALNNGLIQTVVRPEMRGRVMSMVMLIWGGMPLGVLPQRVCGGLWHCLGLKRIGPWASWGAPLGSLAAAESETPQARALESLPPRAQTRVGEAGGDRFMGSRRVPGPRLRLRDQALALGAALLLAPASAAAESLSDARRFSERSRRRCSQYPRGFGARLAGGDAHWRSNLSTLANL